MNLYFCVPTFKELESVKRFVDSVSMLDLQGFPVTVVIANSGFHDETSVFIKSLPVSQIDILELHGNSDEFWGAAVNRSFDSVVSLSQSPDDVVILCNVDIVFDQDTIAELLKVYLANNKSCVGSMGYFDNRIISSGVVCSSPFYGFNKHPYAGSAHDFTAAELSIDCDFLPGRLMAFSILYLNDGLRIDSANFPHYHADYVFSYDLRRRGASLKLALKSRFYSDRENTGDSPFVGNNNVVDRIRGTFSLRSSSNPRYKIRFISRVTERRYKALAFLVAMVKSGLEISLGQRVKRLFGLKDRGF